MAAYTTSADLGTQFREVPIAGSAYPAFSDVEKYMRDVPDSELHRLLLTYQQGELAVYATAADIEVSQRETASMAGTVWSFQKFDEKQELSCLMHGRKLATTVHYEQAKYMPDPAATLAKALAKMRVTATETQTSQSFGAILAAMRVSTYLDNSDIQHLRHCVSVLFWFAQREQSGDRSERFVTRIRMWLSQVVARLLSVATYEDHRFLLQHLLQCKGVGAWAAGFLQFPSVWNSQNLEHFAAQLRVFLEPPVVISEDDYIKLMEQLPFDAMLYFLFGSDSATTYTEALFAFGFCNQLLTLCTTGLQTFVSYPHFLKLIGTTVLGIVQSATQFKVGQLLANMQEMTEAECSRLQQEVDRLHLQAVQLFLGSQQNPALMQFLASLPFESIQLSAAWEVFRLVNAAKSAMSVGTESLYLLETLTSLARAQDGDLPVTILSELFQVGFVLTATRDTMFKPVQHMLVAICQAHPHAISALLRAVQSDFASIGKVSHLLFRTLPLKRWRLQDRDLDVIRALLLSPLTSDECTLAKEILEGLNWSTDDTSLELDSWFLPAALHRDTMLLLAEAYTTHVAAPRSGLVALIRGDGRLQFEQWIWGVLLQLRVHSASGIPMLPAFELSTAQQLAALRQLPLPQHPVLAYVALSVSNCGHDVRAFVADGAFFLLTIIQRKHEQAAIQLLLRLLPGLASQHRIGEKCMLTAILAELTMTELTSAAVVTQLAIRCFVAQSVATPCDVPGILMTWLDELSHLPDWQKDARIRTIINDMTVMAMLAGRSDVVQRFLSRQHELVSSRAATAMQSAGVFAKWRQGSVPTSLLMGTSSVFATASPLVALKGCSWLAFEVLCMETLLERDVFAAFGVALLQDPRITIVKLAQSQGMEKQIPYFTIFRWALYILSMEFDDNAMPLFCEAFFSLYLAHLSNGYYGHFMFSSHRDGDVKLKQQLSAHLQNASSFHAQKAKDTEAAPSKTPHEALAATYNAMVLWLRDDDPTNLTYQLQTLSLDYCVPRLVSLLQEDMFVTRQALWMDLVGMPALYQWAASQCKMWNVRCTIPYVPLSPRGTSASSTSHPPSTNPAAAIASGIRASKAVPPPPVQSAISLIPTLAIGSQELDTAFETDLARLSAAAGVYGDRLARFVAVDSDYLETLPQLWRNVQQQQRIPKTCGMPNCSPPALFIFTFHERQHLPHVQALLDTNRGLARDFVLKSQEVSYEVCLAALRLENFVLQLERAKDAAAPVGCRWFYRVCDMFNSAVRLYPPTRTFLATILRRLCTAFVANDEREGLKLLGSILADSERIPVLADCLQPAKTPNLFMPMFQIALEADSHLSASASTAVLSRFDTAEFLRYEPPRATRIKLLLLLSDAMQRRLSNYATWPIFHNSFKLLSQYLFPELYGEMLRTMLEGSKSGSLPAEVWWGVLELPLNTLPLELVKQSIERFVQYLWDLRAPPTSVPTPLFACWGRYTDPYVAIMTVLLSETTLSGDLSSLWQAFQPFIVPVARGTAPRITFYPPWDPPSSETASKLVRVYVRLASDAHAKNPQALPQLWQYACSTLLANAQPHVAAVMHAQLVQVPWKQWEFTSDDVEQMVQLVSTPSPMFYFVRDVVMQLDLERAQQAHAQGEQGSEYCSRLLMLLLRLLHSQRLPIDATFVPLLETARKLNWNALSSDTYESLLFDSNISSWPSIPAPNWVATASSPALRDSDALYSTNLSLIRAVAGHTRLSPTTPTEETEACIAKMCEYIRYSLSVVCGQSGTATAQSLLTAGRGGAVVLELLRDVDSVCHVAALTITRAIELFQEVLALLNVAQQPLLEEGCKAFIEFIITAPQSAVALLSASCATLTNMSTLSRLVEHLITTAVMSGADWNTVLQAFVPPEVYEHEFVENCVAGSCALTLYAALKQRTYRCRSLEDEFRLLQWALGFVHRMRPPRGDEHKMLLLWAETLFLLLNQITYAPSSQSIVMMHTFAVTVLKYAEDRSGDGVLGMIGLGDKSVYSVPFRIAARCIATFVEYQFMETGGFRMMPNAPVLRNKTADKHIQALLALGRNRDYATYAQTITSLHQYIVDPQYCLTNVLQLVSTVCSLLYPSFGWLRR